MKRGSLFWKDSSGSAVWFVAILMFIIAGLLAFTIDLAHVKTVKTELSNAADACSLRGARAFLPDDVPVTPLPVVMDPDPDRAKTEAQDTITKNKSDNSAFQLADLPLGDIEVGIWDYTNRTLLAWEWPPPSSMWGSYIGPGVRLPTKRTEDTSLGAVATGLARIFGIDTVDVHATSTAALSGFGGPGEGSPILPFGAWDSQVDNYDPGDLHHGTFNRDGTDTMGWTNLDPRDTNPNANELKTIMEQGALYDCPYGSLVGINNGEVTSALHTMTKNGNRFGLEETGHKTNVYEPSTEVNPASDPYNPVTYAATVYMMPVFTSPTHPTDPEKYNHSAVVGGIPVQIIAVSDSEGDKYIDVRIMGGTYWGSGHGGGKFYGILAQEPKLVQ